MAPTPPPLPPRFPQQPLEYARPGVPDERRCPGALITLGILSLLVALGSLLTNVIAYPGNRQFHAWSAPPTPPPQAPPAVGLVPFRGNYVAPGGLRAAERDRVIAAIEGHGKLLGDRREVLSRFLADVGADAFGPMDAGPSAAAPKLEVSRDSADGPDGPGFAADVVRTATGMLRVYNRSASFRRTDGPTTTMEFNVVTGPSGGRRWSAWAIDRALDRTHRQPLPVALNALQGAAIVRELEPLVPPPPRPAGGPPAPGRMTTSADWTLPELYLRQHLGYGTLEGSLNGRTFWVLADGRLVYPPPGADWDSATGAARPAGGFQTMHLPIPRWATWTLLADNFVSVALALVLLAAGIATVARASWSGELHRIYAVLKLVMSAAAIAASAAIILRWPNRADLAPASALTGRVVMGGLVWLAYPVVVLSVLSSESVRAYFGAMGARRWMLPPTIGDRMRSTAGAWLGVSALAGLLCAGEVGVAVVAAVQGGRGAAVAHAAGAVACAAVAVCSWRWRALARTLSGRSA